MCHACRMCRQSRTGRHDSGRQRGGAVQSEAQPEASASGEQVTLELYLQKTNVVDIFKEMIAKFEEQNPDIKIELTSVPDPETALVTRIASNDYPDIVTIWACGEVLPRPHA